MKEWIHEINEAELPQQISYGLTEAESSFCK